MPKLQSLHAKILFGYSLLGLLFVALVASALLNFAVIETRIAEQQRVADFHDELRYARRMEKNYLLYGKASDLSEGIERANNAMGLISQLPKQLSDSLIQENDVATLEHYRALLVVLATLDSHSAIPRDISEGLWAHGSRLLSLGEKLDNEARNLLHEAVLEHHHDLQLTILAAIAVALLAGIMVTRSVVRPLRAIESSLFRVAAGETGQLEQASEDHEVGTLTDAINRTLQKLYERQRAITRSSRLVALGTMLSGVAHELNNPLSNISTSCQILLEELDTLPLEDRRQLLGQIDGEVLRAQDIVSTLLDFARERRSERQREALKPVVEEVLRLTRNLTPPDATITVDIPEHCTIDVDRQRFQQVLINLLQNSAGAIGRGGQITIRAERTATPDLPGTRIEISDNGPGIDPENLPHIFDPFFSTKPVGQGTGLGLFIAHEIVTHHGGTISVDSKPGEACRFSVYIPDTSKTELPHETRTDFSR